jgi:hypothetical protein
MNQERIVSRREAVGRALTDFELDQVGGGEYTPRHLTSDPSDPTGGHDHWDAGGADF